jgi:hypothetical protein
MRRADVGPPIPRGYILGQRGKGSSVKYEKPGIVDYGSIADHTFDTPGQGDKGLCGNDPMFGEPSCPS